VYLLRGPFSSTSVGFSLSLHDALPISLTVLGVCAGLFGVLPRVVSHMGWFLVGVIGIVNLFAQLLDLPQWFRCLSPMWHLASVPVEDFDVVAVLVLIGVMVVALGFGLVGFRRRQINVV